MMPDYYARVLSLPMSRNRCTMYGIDSTTHGFLSVVTLDFGLDDHIRNVTVCFSSLKLSILSKSVMESLGYCHCPGVGLKVC